MARLVLCVLAFFTVGALSEPIKKATQKVVDPVLLQRQSDLILLFSHLHEPNHVESCRAIYNNWTFEKNIEHFSNFTAVQTYMELLEHKWMLPKAMPFSIYQNKHRFEAVTLFNVLFSAKDYDTFYKSAVYLRERVNEYLFSYVLTVVIYNRKDTQGIFVPHAYDIFPSFFLNNEILKTAQSINTHGQHYIQFYPSTYKWDDKVVIRWNTSHWPYSWNYADTQIVYFTHDYEFNSFYYNLHLISPSWLGGDVIPLVKDRRGEWFWFIHKQMLARYYLERLSNRLGEIPVLGQDVVKHGYSCGLAYSNGIFFPARPDNFRLDQPEYVEIIQAINDAEHRIREAIDQGYIVNDVGEHINLRVPEAIDILGRVIEANVDSPNIQYYKDFISLWKTLLGNSPRNNEFYKHLTPLIVPSVMEHYQTALRDHAFYMIFKRVMGLFQLWQESLPQYNRNELSLPQVAIEKVEVDKLMTYFENAYVNVSNQLYTHVKENKGVQDKVNVLVQHMRINHKQFKIRVNVKSEVAKTVVVRFFFAPKYDSVGHEIPLHQNSQNFYLFDEFIYDLPAGETVINRDSDMNVNAGKEWPHTSEVYNKAQKALNLHGQFRIYQIHNVFKFPQRLVLPKGRIDGMPFVLAVYISEYRAPVVPLGAGFDPSISLGIGSGARLLTSEPLGFPFNRPIHNWQVNGLRNMFFQDILIYHKHTPEIGIPHSE